MSSCLDQWKDVLGKFNLEGVVAVAVSGGADSMALMNLMRQTYPSVVALTVDHQLRPESRQEAEQVVAWMAEWEVEHTILTWQEPSHQRLQERARQARYQLMGDWCQEHGVDVLMTAHHQDDMIETYWMRVFKGSGLSGLCGMRAERKMPFGRLIRPALDMSRDVLRQALGNHLFLDDPSNDNTKFERVRIRQWLRDKPEQREAALRSISQLCEAEAFIRHYVDQAYSAYVISTSLRLCEEHGDVAVHMKQGWQDLPLLISQRLLQRVVQEVGGKEYPLSHDLVLRVDKALRNGKAITAGGVLFCPKRGTVSLQLEQDSRRV